MGFGGLEEFKKSVGGKGGGGWVKLIEDQPVRLTIHGWLGQFASKKFPDKAQDRFEVSNGDGEHKNLDCGWRLSTQLLALAEEYNGPFTVTITRSQGIEEVKQKDGTKKKSLVNLFKVESPEQATESAPF